MNTCLQGAQEFQLSNGSYFKLLWLLEMEILTVMSSRAIGVKWPAVWRNEWVADKSAVPYIIVERGLVPTCAPLFDRQMPRSFTLLSLLQQHWNIYKLKKVLSQPVRDEKEHAWMFRIALCLCLPFVDPILRIYIHKKEMWDTLKVSKLRAKEKSCERKRKKHRLIVFCTHVSKSLLGNIISILYNVSACAQRTVSPYLLSFLHATWMHFWSTRDQDIPFPCIYVL